RGRRTAGVGSLLDDLEVPPRLPVGDRLAELPPLPSARGREMLDERVTKQFARDGRLVEALGRLGQVARQARRELVGVATADDGRGVELQLLLDAQQATADGGRH